MLDSVVNMLLFKPPDSFPYTFDEDVVRLRTDTGNLIAGVFVRKEGASLTLLFSHGNAEDLTTSYAWMKKMSKALNVNVFGYDYAGYGESTGSPNEKNCYADIDAVYHYLVSRERILPETIILYGRSLGSGPSCYLAEKTSLQGRPIACLILHSPFISVYRVVVDFGFSGWGDKFVNIDRVPNIKCPAFIIHGRNDTVVPFEHGTLLHDALPAKYKARPFWVKGMGHNNPGFHVEVVLVDQINQFLNYYVIQKRPVSLQKPEQEQHTVSSKVWCAVAN